MATIYSAVVFHDFVVIGSVPPTIYTVPAGHVFVCRDLEWYQDQRFGVPASVVRMSENVADRWWYAAGMPITAFSHLQWQGRQVFTEGMQLGACCDANAVELRVSGFLLTAP